MNFCEFVAFLETRPDEEKWELVEEVPVRSEAPAFRHQLIVANAIVELRHVREMRTLAVIPGIGVQVNEFNVPVPDVMIRPLDSLDGSFCDDMLLAREVLSPGTASRDRKWKRQVYAALPSLRHYLTISPKRVDVTLFSRERAFEEHRLTDPSAVVELADLGVAMPLASLYRDTGLV
jgi:Uma2 family endonuclease